MPGHAFTSHLISQRTNNKSKKKSVEVVPVLVSKCVHRLNTQAFGVRGRHHDKNRVCVPTPGARDKQHRSESERKREGHMSERKCRQSVVRSSICKQQQEEDKQMNDEHQQQQLRHQHQQPFFSNDMHDAAAAGLGLGSSVCSWLYG